MPKNPYLEVLKEIARWGVLGIISFLLTEGVINSIMQLIFGTRLDPQVAALVIGGITSILRKIDEQLHDMPSFMPYGAGNKANGLLPF